MPQIALQLPATVQAPALARAALRDISGTLASEDRWRAEMVLTELVTNAVLHGPGGPVELALETGGGGVRGQVDDPGHGIGSRAAESRDRDGGRGLMLVELLSDRWGTTRGVSRVWFEVAARA